ncbi:hypothetical protein D3C81_1604830 [compost metagenome]
MAPEPRVPNPVKLIQRFVTLPQPNAESRSAIVAITVPAVFVGDMPDEQAWMVLIMFGELAGQTCGIFAVGRRVRAGVMTSAKPTFSTLHVNAQHVRVFMGHPSRVCSRARCEAYMNSALVQAVDRFVQLREVIGFFVRLIQCPGKDVNRSNVDARQLKHPFVLFPNVRSPLLRIVVATIPDFRQFIVDHPTHIL